MLLPAKIVDAHHHLWDLSVNDYPWLMRRGERRFFGDPTPIQRNYELHDFRSDIGDLPVVQSVHIQVGIAEAAAVDETRWLQAVADNDLAWGMPNAIVAYADLSSQSFAMQLAAHRTSANLRGIRQILGRHSTEDRGSGSSQLLDNPTWKNNLRQFAGTGLSFDLQLTPSQLATSFQVFSCCPELPVAICHAGSPGAEPAEFDVWRTGMKLWGSLPNAYCKLSGFGMFDPTWSAQRVQSHFEVVCEAFGPARLMFGSNYPVEKLVKPYANVWYEYANICKHLSAEDQSALFASNAARFYRIN